MSKAVTDYGRRCPECNGRMVKSSSVIINRSRDKKQQWICVVCLRRTLNPRVENCPEEVNRVSTNTTD